MLGIGCGDLCEASQVVVLQGQQAHSGSVPQPSGACSVEA